MSMLAAIHSAVYGDLPGQSASQQSEPGHHQLAAHPIAPRASAPIGGASWATAVAKVNQRLPAPLASTSPGDRTTQRGGSQGTPRASWAVAVARANARLNGAGVLSGRNSALSGASIEE